MTTLVQSFPPIEHAAARTLILGTMPGAASLVAREYYAHPRNLFWTIFADLLGFLRAAPYAVRIAHLRTADIAVWDVLKSCDRPGSLDSSIERTSAVANDFERFFASHPHVERVFFNGAGAATLYRRHVLPSLKHASAIHYTRLPSTSPANAGISAAAKRRAWQVVLDDTSGVISPADQTKTTEDVIMPRFIIERDIPQIGSADREALRAAAQKSNSVLAEMQAEKKPIQWEHSYVAGDKTFCIYHAGNEALIHEHAKRSGFPATKITPVRKMIDPATADA